MDCSKIYFRVDKLTRIPMRIMVTAMATPITIFSTTLNSTRSVDSSDGAAVVVAPKGAAVVVAPKGAAVVVAPKGAAVVVAVVIPRGAAVVGTAGSVDTSIYNVLYDFIFYSSRMVEP
jgi:hypothetical protein